MDNKRSKSGVPTLNTDWWNYGGLTRGVKLVRTPAKYIADHRFALESEESKIISGSVTVANASAGEDVVLAIAELDQQLTAKTDAGGQATFRFAAPNLKLWSPAQPKLYEVAIRHGDNQISEPIGFRTVRTSGKQILLNGKPVFLRGICIHEEFPLNGGGRVKNGEQAEQLL